MSELRSWSAGDPEPPADVVELADADGYPLERSVSSPKFWHYADSEERFAWADLHEFDIGWPVVEVLPETPTPEVEHLVEVDANGVLGDCIDDCPGCEDACPHCSPTHSPPESRPWGVYVSPQRDGDGQPTHLTVMPSNGAHVAQSDADWLWQLIRDYEPAAPVSVVQDDTPTPRAMLGLGDAPVELAERLVRVAHDVLGNDTKNVLNCSTAHLIATVLRELDEEVTKAESFDLAWPYAGDLERLADEVEGTQG